MADAKITELTSYSPAIDADVLPIVDITTSTTKKIAWSAVKSTLKTYFDGLYVISKATQAEVATGTDDAKYTTPLAVAPYANQSLLRQAIINGNFDVWQRGTSFDTVSQYSADRWRLSMTGSACTTTQQAFTIGQTDVPNEPKYYIRNVVTSSAGNGNYVALEQRIESVRTLAGKTVTLSFYAKADAGKDIAIELRQNFGSGGSPSAVVIASATKKALTTSWAKYTVTANIPSISGKTLGTTNDGYLDLAFWFEAGSDFNTNTDTLGQQSGTFEISQVQLNAGSVALPFQPKSFAEELRDCQRYCIVYSGSEAYYRLVNGFNVSTTIFAGQLQLPVKMRITPSSGVFSGTWTVFNSTDVATTATYESTGSSPISVQITGTSTGLTAGAGGVLRAGNDATATLTLSSEL